MAILVLCALLTRSTLMDEKSRLSTHVWHKGVSMHRQIANEQRGWRRYWIYCYL